MAVNLLLFQVFFLLWDKKGINFNKTEKNCLRWGFLRIWPEVSSSYCGTSNLKQSNKFALIWEKSCQLFQSSSYCATTKEIHFNKCKEILGSQGFPEDFFFILRYKKMNKFLKEQKFLSITNIMYCTYKF